MINRYDKLAFFKFNFQINILIIQRKLDYYRCEIVDIIFINVYKYVNKSQLNFLFR